MNRVHNSKHGHESLRRHVTIVALVCLAFFALSVGVGAQGEVASDVTQAVDPMSEEIVSQVLIDIPAQGIGYSEQGELLLFATLTNIGSQLSAPLDLIAIVLNDCILPEVPQTCRFAAFGSFEQVTPNGIAAGNTVQWTFNFGINPQVDLSRWSVIWYQVR